MCPSSGSLLEKRSEGQGGGVFDDEAPPLSLALTQIHIPMATLDTHLDQTLYLKRLRCGERLQTIKCGLKSAEF